MNNGILCWSVLLASVEMMLLANLDGDLLAGRWHACLHAV